MRLIMARRKLVLIFSILQWVIFFGGMNYAQAGDIYDMPVLTITTQSSARGNPDNMVNLIIGAAVIVLVIFAGVVFRRPKS